MRLLEDDGVCGDGHMVTKGEFVEKLEFYGCYF